MLVDEKINSFIDEIWEIRLRHVGAAFHEIGF